MKQQQLMEVFIACNAEGFTEMLVPAAQPLKDYYRDEHSIAGRCTGRNKFASDTMDKGNCRRA
jgi:hypothetical protein